MQNKISSPIRAQVKLPSLAPSFYTPFFDKKPAFSVFKSRNRREYHKKSDKPPPAEPYFLSVRQEQLRCVGCRSPPSVSLKTTHFSNFSEVTAMSKKREERANYYLYIHHQPHSCVGRSQNSSIPGRPWKQQDYHGHLCKGQIQPAGWAGEINERRICRLGSSLRIK